MVGKLTNKMLFVGKMWNLHVNTRPPPKVAASLRHCVFAKKAGLLYFLNERMKLILSKSIEHSTRQNMKKIYDRCPGPSLER